MVTHIFAAGTAAPSSLPVALDSVNLCVGWGKWQGGLHRGIMDFCDALGGDVLSLSDGPAGSTDASVEDGVSITRVGCGSAWLSGKVQMPTRRVFQAAEAHLKGRGLAICHSLFRAHAVLVSEVHRRDGIPYWVVPHGCLDPWAMQQRGVSKRIWLSVLGDRLLSRAARIVCATVREQIKASLWTDSDRCVTAHWPVPRMDFSHAAELRQRFRAAYGIQENDTVFLFCGRLHPMKRPVETIRAFCARTPPGGHLVIIGGPNGLSKEDLESSIIPAMRSKVHIIGAAYGDELRRAYLGSDVFISLSARENFSYALGDALAAGLPVIVSQGNDLAHELPRKPNRSLACGWIVGPSQREAEAAITQAVKTPGVVRRRLGLTGQAWARDVLCPQRFRDRLRQLL